MLVFLQVDLIKLSSFPVLKKFLGTDEDLDLKVFSTHYEVKLNVYVAEWLDGEPRQEISSNLVIQ